jgi:methylmalonyl-CoA mutase N-terminal domain/subunit
VSNSNTQRKERIYGSQTFGDAGEFPFTRGIHPEMYRKKLWTMRQYAGFGDATAANARFRYLLSQGTTGLSVAFDLPTQMGRDPDHELARGEVGKVGVSIATRDDIAELFSQIDLAQASVSMTINATATILLSLLCVKAKQDGTKLSELRGTTQNDILKEYIARGTYIYPPKGAMKLTTDLMLFCKQELPQWNTISISGYHIREAGSTAAQEIAFTLADGIAYIEAALQKGLSIDEFAPRLSFFFNGHSNFFEEIAKFRAARQLWAELVQQRYHPQKKESMQLRFHTQTAGSTLTAQQPENNIVRTTLQALAAVLGGTQSLHTNGFDEALRLPTKEAATLALRTQQIIAHESGVVDVVDPLGGSPYIEALTEGLIADARVLIDKIDQQGGMIAAIENYFPQGEIEKAAYEYQKAVEDKRSIVVGVNDFIVEDPQPSASQPGAPLDMKKLESSIRDKVAQFKASRAPAPALQALEVLRAAATEDRNTMPLTIAALEAGCTLGEISDIFRSIFGEYHAA